MRFAGDNVAIVSVFAILKLTTPGTPPQVNARPRLVVERRDGGWKIVTFQNTMVTPQGAPVGKDAISAQHPFKGQGEALVGQLLKVLDDNSIP